MTPEEAKEILIKNRPDRPKATERRQLQKAIDVIIEALKDRSIGKWIPRLHASENEIYICSNCKQEVGYDPRYCPHCGAYMGEWEYGE